MDRLADGIATETVAVIVTIFMWGLALVGLLFTAMLIGMQQMTGMGGMTGSPQFVPLGAPIGNTIGDVASWAGDRGAAVHAAFSNYMGGDYGLG